MKRTGFVAIVCTHPHHISLSINKKSDIVRQNVMANTFIEICSQGKKATQTKTTTMQLPRH